MPYRGSRDEVVDDFEGYDPTPYSGGYDISLTYGRPLQPSDDICYPISFTGGVDYERPHYPLGSYEASNVQKGDCYGLLRPSQQAAYNFPPELQPETNAGYPGHGYKNYGSDVTGGAGFAGDANYEPGHGQRPQPHEHGSTDYVSGYYGRPQRQEYGYEYGSEQRSGYARPEGSFGYGSGGYPRSTAEGYGRQGYEGSQYGRSEEEAGRGYRRHADYVYEGNLSYERPNYGVGQEQRIVPRDLGYGGVQEQRAGYMKPSYYSGKEGEEYGSSKYGNDSDDEKKKQHHRKHHHHHHYDD